MFQFVCIFQPDYGRNVLQGKGVPYQDLGPLQGQQLGLGGRKSIFYGAFLSFWCKADRVSTSRREMVAKIHEKDIPWGKERKKRGFKIQLIPTLEFHHMCCNFTFWEVLFVWKMFVPLYYLLCTATFLQSIIPSSFPEYCHDLDAITTVALKGGTEQYAMQTT